LSSKIHQASDAIELLTNFDFVPFAVGRHGMIPNQFPALALDRL
jgi:hypothetical protein